MLQPSLRSSTTRLAYRALCLWGGFTITAAAPVFAQNRVGTGEVRKQYEMYCASCHGTEMEGGLGGSLLDRSAWKEVGKSVSFLEYVRNGNPEVGMPSFKEALTDEEIRALEILIAEVTQTKEREDSPAVEVNDGVYKSGPYAFRVETVVDDLETPWSMDFDPDGGIWVTEKKGRLRYFDPQGKGVAIKGIPEVWDRGQGGLMEVALHPDYRDNGWIYLSFSARSGEDARGRAIGMTKVVRGKVVGNRWTAEETLFETPVEFHSSRGLHFGSRFVFHEGYLYFPIGDRGQMGDAQDLSKPNGKIHRIHDDGRIPQDNPFVGVSGAYPTIWTYGNRNPQGLDLHPATGELWESEHGPRGGDEINLIEKGVNYGWPVITHGMNYDGRPITSRTEAPGMAQPVHHWTPSIAVCGMDFYEGSNLVFPEWKHDLFAGGLRSQELHRLRIVDGRVTEAEIVVKGTGRVRDVASGPDGYLYLVLNSPDVIARLVPVSEAYR